MKTKTKNFTFKLGVSFLAGIFVFVLAANAGTITISSNIANALQVIQRLFISDDGTQT